MHPKAEIRPDKSKKGINTSFPKKPQLSSLKISKKNDKQEQEADAVADRVMLMPSNKQQDIAMSGSPKAALHLSANQEQDTLTLQENENEKDDSLQLMPDLHLQEMAGNPDDTEDESTISTKIDSENRSNSLQLKEEDTLDMQTEDEDTSKISLKSADSEEEIDRTAEDDDNLQLKEDEEKLNLQENEDKESDLNMQGDESASNEAVSGNDESELQAKRIQTKDGINYAPLGVQNTINRTKGQGNSLPDNTQSELGSKMGADFSNVKVHNDRDASGMNSQLGAKAFAHGNDIYFKSGEYNPGSSQGKRLLAHELTHTVQQGASKSVQKKEAVENNETTTLESPEQDLTSDKKNPKDSEQESVTKDSEEKAQQPDTETISEKDTENTKDTSQTNTDKASETADTSGQKEKATGKEKKEESEKKEEGKKEDKDKSEEEKVTEEGGESAEKEEEGTERFTDMTAPEMDGGAERLTKENEDNKGVVGQELKDLSKKSTSRGMGKIGRLSKNEQKKEAVDTKMKQIDDAVEEKPEDKKAEVKTSQVEKVDSLKAPEASNDKPKKELKEKMEASLPNKVKDVEKFKDRGKGVYIGEQVGKIVNQETAKVESTYEQIEKTPEPAKPKENIPVGEIEKPEDTPKLNVGKNLVPEVDEAKIDLTQYDKESDNLLEREGISEENLEMVDSGELAEAKEERKGIKENTKKSPAAVKEFEKKEKKGVEKDLQKQENYNRKSMRSKREKGLKEARGEQKKTKLTIEQERENVTKKINGFYDKANIDVKKKLSDLEKKSLSAFDKIQRKASRAFQNNVKSRLAKYKKKRYRGWRKIKKIKDWAVGMNQLSGVKTIFNSEKKAFITSLDNAITKITNDSKKVIKECKDTIAQARKDIDKYVKGLRPALQKTGKGAQKSIKEKLDKLDKEVEKAEANLKQKLKERRDAAIKEIEKQIEKMKEAMSGALAKLGNLLLDAALKFFKWALEKAGYSTKQIMGIINKGKAVITKIVTDPKGFFSNLGKGVGQGIKSFSKNIKTHLIKGLINWLTGAMGDTGLVLPKTWNLKGIFSLFLQVMGLSYNFLRTRLVKYVGEPIVAAAEGGFEMVKKIRKEGPIAIWNWIKEKAGEIKQSIFDGIRNWVITQVIKKAILKIVSMLNPAGAIVQAILAIYDVVMFFVDNWQRIVDMVKTIFSTISDIAAGRLGIVAKKVEQIMAMTIPMIISFLARFLGLSGLAKVIKNLIKKVRQPVVKIMDKAAKWIGKKVKKLFKKGKKGVKKRSKKEQKKKTKDDKKSKSRKEIDKKVKKGLAAVNSEESKIDKDKDRELTMEEAKVVASRIKKKHRVFKVFKVVDGGANWDYFWKANPSGKRKGKKKEKDGITKIKVKRSSFRLSTKWSLMESDSGSHKKHVKGRGPRLKKSLDRRHVVSSQTMANHYNTVLNDKKWSEAKKILNPKKSVKDPLGNKTIQAAAKALHRDFFNDVKNLFIGDASKNRSIGAETDIPEDWTQEVWKKHLKYIKKNYTLDSSFEA